MGQSKLTKPIPGSSAFVLIIFLVLIGVLLVSTKNSRSKQNQNIHNKSRLSSTVTDQPESVGWRRDLDPAWAGEFAVEKNLLSPSTAKFIGIPVVDSSDKNRIIVTGELDGANAFSAIIRQKWRVEFQPVLSDDGNWVPKYQFIQIGSQIILDE